MRLKLRLGLSAFSGLSLWTLGEGVASPFALPLRTALSRFASASNRPERSEGAHGKLREGAQGKLREPSEGSRRKRHAETQGKK